MARLVLLLNCGSSSIKYQVSDADTEEVVAKGLVQKVGDVGVGTLDHEVGDQEFHIDQHFANHTEALNTVLGMFREHGPDLDSVIAVGHRTVHGGRTFQKTTLINDEVVAKLKELFGLAPLHNPAGVAGIEAAVAALPDVPHVAIFDTSFFSTLPAEAYSYAVDTELADQYGIRKYGFHGTSHDYVSATAGEFLGTTRDELKIIVLHLGNGASASAIDHGQPVETSMGMTPLQGLVMGTRTGDIDPGLAAFLHRKLGWEVDEIDTWLNKKSGMLGLTGKTDMREVKALIDAGDEKAKAGVEVYVHRLLSYIGSYTAVLGGLDALVFTAGVGENADWIRALVVERLAPFGVKLDAEANAVRSKDPRAITTEDSSVKVLVVPTNEELKMAREVVALIENS
ncbi:acetate/propionate family kinase [Propionibacteriaceae bacterium G1746]